MSHYKTANIHCNNYRNAADKMAEATKYLVSAVKELSKNKSAEIENLKTKISELCHYEIEQNKEITKIINQTLKEAKDKDEKEELERLRRLEEQKELELDNRT